MLLSIVLYGLIFAIPYFLLASSYRLAFHPLKKYPGPMLGRLTHLYGAYHAMLRRGHLATHANHLKYGSVVRQGPDRLVFNTISAYQDIYVNPQVTKSFVYVLTRQTPVGNVFDTVEVDEHRRKRKIIGQPISSKAMRAFEPIMQQMVDVFIRQLLRSARQSDPVNMSRRAEYLGGDVVGHLGFGYPLKMQSEEANRWLMYGLSFVNVRINLYMQFPRLHLIEPLVKTLATPVRKRYRSIIQKMVMSRTAKPKDASHDLYAFAVDSMVGGTSLYDSELWAECFFFIVAGGATTATAIAALFFYLSRNPACYGKVCEEVRSRFTSGKDIKTGDTLKGCVYLRACINEALRMSPPAPGMPWREQVPIQKDASGREKDVPLVVDGHLIPRGTQVAVNSYALHHNEEYYPDPFVFKPERWLTPEAEDASSPMRKAFVPFSLGARGCGGKAVAYLEISLTLAKSLYYFDLSVPDGAEAQIGAGINGRKDGRGRVDEFQLYDVFTALHDGPVLMVKERKGISDELIEA